VKVAFLLDDEQLIQRFIEKNPNKEVELDFFNHSESMLSALSIKQFDTLILSDRNFEFLLLCEFIELIKEINETRIILLLSNQHDGKNQEKYIKYCLTNEIIYIHPGQTVSIIAEKVYNHIFYKKTGEPPINKNIIMFMGSTPNIGTTVVSYSAAMLIANQTEQQVAYVCLNLKSSKIHNYMGIHQPVTTLDGIRAEIKSRGLTEERLRQYCINNKDIPNFYVLLGNMVREQAEFYTVEDVHHLLDILSAAFDLCVVEVNAYWDNAATISGLLCASTKIVVTSNQLGSFQEDLDRWIKSGSPIFDIDVQSFDLFITQLQKKPLANGYRIKDVRKETGMNIIGRLNRLEQVDEFLNQGRINDFAMNDPQLIRGLSGMINMLITLYRLDIKKPLAKRNWLNRLLLKEV
jgi:hypothetical protein